MNNKLQKTIIAIQMGMQALPAMDKYGLLAIQYLIIILVGNIAELMGKHLNAVSFILISAFIAEPIVLLVAAKAIKARAAEKNSSTKE